MLVINVPEKEGNEIVNSEWHTLGNIRTLIEFPYEFNKKSAK